MTDRKFWVGFGAGWAVFFALNIFAEIAGGRSTAGTALVWGLIITAPPVFSSWIVALNRRRLLRPEWGGLKTVAVHAGVGLAFALATAAGIALLDRALGLSAVEAQEGTEAWGFVPQVVLSGFLYIMFFGALMWSESIRRVQESHRAAAREAVLRAEAEAKALRAQFNPHFVFNTLHSLMLLVRADPATAERAIEDVATMIRYASILQRNDIDVVPLAKELEVVRRYVALEELRLAHRLELSWDLQVDPASVSVPAFALQTLVENAIRHGIEPVPEGGRVGIAIQRTDAGVEVCVSDDGRGADPSTVNLEPGHGLALLRDRLDARYGADSEFGWETRPGAGFSVRIRFPLEEPSPTPELDVIEVRQATGGD